MSENREGSIEQPQPKPTPSAKPAPAPASRRRWGRIAIIAVVAAVVIFVGIPQVGHALHTVSTDDAYVNSYVTFVAPRVAGQVTRVLVEDNNRVKKGDVLVELDPEPYRVQVAIKEAAVNAAQADLAIAQATVRSEASQTRSLRFALEHTIEDVDNKVALLSVQAAALDQAKAAQVLALQEFNRAKHLLETRVISADDFDIKREALDAANAAVTQALENVRQSRVALGLPRDPPRGKSLTDVPADIDQTFSTVREAVGDLMKSAAQLGIVSASFNLTPKELLDSFMKRDPSGNIDRILAAIIKDAPAL